MSSPRRTSLGEQEPLLDPILIPGNDRTRFGRSKLGASIQSNDILPWGHTASSPSRGERHKGNGNDWEFSQSFDEELRTPGERRDVRRASNVSLSQSQASYSNNGLDDSQTSQSYGRRAFQHQSANPRLTIKHHADSNDSVDDRALRSITYNRMKFYGKIAPANRENALVMPIHAAPPSLFSPLWFINGKKGTQSSLVSILSIWNTMMGTSVLAMPWAIQQAGFALGCGTIFAMMLLTLYTCSIILHRGQNGYLNGEAVEFSDVVRHYLGESAYRVASSFSIMTLWGAGMVLWVLMTSFLGNILTYFEESHGPHATGVQFTTSLWNPHVVPLYLIVLLFPLMCVKDISFFTKFNSLGVLSIIYMLFFVVFTTAYGDHYQVKDAHGVYNANISSPFGGFHMDTVKNNVVMAKPTNVFALTGVLTLSYFIHNGCLSIMRNAEHPENNPRDLKIAYLLVCATYLLIGICFFVSFNGDKDCLPDNFLSCPIPRLKDKDGHDCPCFATTDQNYVYVLVAQCFLFLQFVTVFPLLTYLVRFQAMTMLFNGEAWPSFFHVFVTNVILVSACVAMAIFYPKIGTILRYCGAICGLIYVFALPVLVDRACLIREGKYHWPQAIRVGVVIALGLVNLVGQFMVK